MHKKYIDPSIPVRVDYIPEDMQLCAKCLFFEVCPFDYICDSFERLQEYEALQGDGEKVVKGEE